MALVCSQGTSVALGPVLDNDVFSTCSEATKRVSNVSKTTPKES
jgi:hypothetical protein